MSRRHDKHFAAIWERQCADRGRWSGNLSPEVPVVQPHRLLAGRAPTPSPIALVAAPDRRGASPGTSTSKMGNVPTDGYDSKREAKRGAELIYLEKAGVIRNLSRQVRFLLIPKQDGERECAYVADFAYEEDARTPLEESPRWQFVVEDCKGFRTETYRIKRKLMLMVHGIKIRET